MLAVAGAVGGHYYYKNVWPYVTTDNAFVDASVVRLSPQVSGQVLKVNVNDNQPVKAGDVLVEIDPKPFNIKLSADRAALELAETRFKGAQVTVDLIQATTAATLEQAKANVDAAKAGAEQARAEISAAEAEAQRTEKDVRRYETLEQTAISIQKLDLARVGAEVAQAHLTEARKQIVAADARVAAAIGSLAAAKTGPQQVAVSQSQVEQAAAAVDQVKAAVAGSELNLSYTQVLSPVSGRVTRKSVRVGETVQAGQALMAIVPYDIWVIANFKETQLTRMRPGQPVEVWVDAYPGMMLKGHIDSIQEGTGARFSLLPPENATGNYVKVVQRVPVKIVLDERPDPALNIAPGMSVVPKIKIR
jgi:membrane fusion protein (multidrug efflux system)